MRFPFLIKYLAIFNNYSLYTKDICVYILNIETRSSGFGTVEEKQQIIKEIRQ